MMQFLTTSHALGGGAAAKQFFEALSADAGIKRESDPIKRMMSIAREQQLEREALSEAAKGVK